MVPSAANRIQSPNPTTAFAKLCPRVDELRGEMALGSRLSKLLQYVICFTKLGILLIIHASCSANTTLYHATPQLCKIVEKVCYKEVFFLLLYTLYYIYLIGNPALKADTMFQIARSFTVRVHK